MAVMRSWENRTVAPCLTAPPVTPPVAAVSTAITGSRVSEKVPIRPMVSRPIPIMTAISVMVSAVIASAPAISTAWSPSLLPWAAPSAMAHSRTTASSFSPVAMLARSKEPIWSRASEKRLDKPWSNPPSASTP